MRRHKRPYKAARRGRSSEVERQLPKLNVVGSIPIARSTLSITWLVLPQLPGVRGPNRGPSGVPLRSAPYQMPRTKYHRKRPGYRDYVTELWRLLGPWMRAGVTTSELDTSGLESSLPPEQIEKLHRHLQRYGDAVCEEGFGTDGLPPPAFMLGAEMPASKFIANERLDRHLAPKAHRAKPATEECPVPLEPAEIADHWSAIQPWLKPGADIAKLKVEGLTNEQANEVGLILQQLGQAIREAGTDATGALSDALLSAGRASARQPSRRPPQAAVNEWMVSYVASVHATGQLIKRAHVEKFCMAKLQASRTQARTASDLVPLENIRRRGDHDRWR
jgi:hypothetical protein